MVGPTKLDLINQFSFRGWRAKRALTTLSVVAGPGIAPGSGAYETPEILLLYPAIKVDIILQLNSLISKHKISSLKKGSFVYKNDRQKKNERFKI